MSGYDHEASVLTGELRNDKTKLSWGHHLNKTMEQLIHQVVDLKPFGNFTVGRSHVKDKLFARFGHCAEVFKYSTKEPMIFDLENYFGINDLLIFITDKSRQTFYSINYDSQKGDNMHIQAGNSLVYSYTVDIEVHDMSYSAQFTGCNASEEYSFSDCVDEKIQEDLIPKLGCIPPYLSSKNICKDSAMVSVKDRLHDLYMMPFVFFQVGLI